MGADGSVLPVIRPEEVLGCFVCCAKTKTGSAREKIISAASANENLFFTYDLTGKSYV